MKLSDVKGERALDVVASVIDPIANIAEDAAAAELFRRRKVPEGMNPHSFLVGRIKKSMPALMRGHKRDVIKILSAIEGTSVKEYTNSLDLVKLMADCLELLTDDAFVSLFTSAQDGEGSSGSARENTGAEGL